jgi:hypothetical protein
MTDDTLLPLSKKSMAHRAPCTAYRKKKKKPRHAQPLMWN